MNHLIFRGILTHLDCGLLSGKQTRVYCSRMLSLLLILMNPLLVTTGCKIQTDGILDCSVGIFEQQTKATKSTDTAHFRLEC